MLGRLLLLVLSSHVERKLSCWLSNAIAGVSSSCSRLVSLLALTMGQIHALCLSYCHRWSLKRVHLSRHHILIARSIYILLWSAIELLLLRQSVTILRAVSVVESHQRRFLQVEHAAVKGERGHLGSWAHHI